MLFLFPPQHWAIFSPPQPLNTPQMDNSLPPAHLDLAKPPPRHPGAGFTSVCQWQELTPTSCQPLPPWRSGYPATPIYLPLPLTQITLIRLLGPVNPSSGVVCRIQGSSAALGDSGETWCDKKASLIPPTNPPSNLPKPPPWTPLIPLTLPNPQRP